MFGLGGFEIAIIALFGFLIFGPDKLPQIARTVGRGIRQFRSAQEQMNKVIKTEVYDPIKDLEPLANPFAGFSLDPTKDEKPAASNGKTKINNKEVDVKKISTDAMKSALDQEAAKAKARAKAADEKASKEAAAKDADDSKTAEDKSVAKSEKTSNKSSAGTTKTNAPSESFAERRARLEKEHAKAKAAKAAGVSETTGNPTAAEKTEKKVAKATTKKTEQSDERKEDKEGK